MVVAGANVPDTKLLRQTIAAIVVKRPAPTPEAPQHLCWDKGYDNPTGREAVETHGYVPHIRRIGEEKCAACEEISRSPLGCRTDACLAEQVSGDPGAL